MEQDEQPPADQPEQGESPFAPRLGDSAAESPPPITLADDHRPPIRPYTGQVCAESVTALVLSILGITGSFFCCFGGVTVWMELIALMLAVNAKKKIRADPYVGGDGLATAAISIALVILTLYALVSTAGFVWMVFAF